MKQATLARYTVGVVVLLRIAASLLPPSYAGPYEGISASDAGFQAGSHPLGPVVSAAIFALYIWVLRLPAEPARNYVTADIWRRFLAFCVDFIVAMQIAIPVVGLTAVSVDALQSGHFAWYVHRTQPTDADDSLGSLLMLATVFWVLLYFAWAHHRGRRTPGELLLGIGLKSRDDRPLSVLAAMGRMLLGFVALGFAYLSVPIAFFDPEKRMWQDKAFGTRVVQWTD